MKRVTNLVAMLALVALLALVLGGAAQAEVVVASVTYNFGSGSSMSQGGSYPNLKVSYTQGWGTPGFMPWLDVSSSASTQTIPFTSDSLAAAVTGANTGASFFIGFGNGAWGLDAKSGMSAPGATITGFDLVVSPFSLIYENGDTIFSGPVDFTINALGPEGAATAPEPASFLLLGGGFAAVAALRKKLSSR